MEIRFEDALSTSAVRIEGDTDLSIRIQKRAVEYSIPDGQPAHDPAPDKVTSRVLSVSVVQRIEHRHGDFRPFMPELVGAAQVQQRVAAHSGIWGCEGPGAALRRGDSRENAKEKAYWIGGGRHMVHGRFAAQAIVPFSTQSRACLVGRRRALEETSRDDQVRALPQLRGGIVGEAGQPGGGQKLDAGLPPV